MEKGLIFFLSALLCTGLIPKCYSQGISDVNVVIDGYKRNTALTSGDPVPLGTQLVLICWVVGLPYGTPLSYTWTCPNGPCEVEGYYGRKIHNEHILAVNTTSTSDGETYTCQVTAMGGQGANGSFTLRVNGGRVVHSYGRLIPLDFPITNLQQISDTDGIGRITCTVSSGTAMFQVIGAQKTDVTLTSNGATATLVVNTTNATRFTNRDVTCNGTYFYLFLSPSNPLQVPRLTVNSASTDVEYNFQRNDPETTRVITGYEVFRFGVRMIGEYANKGPASTETSVTISPAVPGAQYRITAWALGGDTRSATPAVEYVTTREARPSAPRMLFITRILEAEIELNWLPPTEPNGEVHYAIYYTPENDTEQSIDTGSNMTHYNLTGLERNRVYTNIAVQANNSAGRSDRSAVIAPPVPTSPREVNIPRVFQDGVELNWLPPTEPNGKVHYVIYYTPENDTERSIDTGRDQTQYNLIGLEMNRVYTNISVQAVNLVGRSDRSAVIAQYNHTPPAAIDTGPTTPASQSNPADNTVPIVAGVVASAVVLLVLLVVVVLVVIVVRRMKMKKKAEHLKYQPEQTSHEGKHPISANTYDIYDMPEIQHHLSADVSGHYELDEAFTGTASAIAAHNINTYDGVQYSEVDQGPGGGGYEVEGMYEEPERSSTAVTVKGMQKAKKKVAHTATKESASKAVNPEELYTQPEKSKKTQKREADKDEGMNTTLGSDQLYAQPDKSKKKQKEKAGGKVEGSNTSPDQLYAQPDKSKKSVKKQGKQQQLQSVTDPEQLYTQPNKARAAGVHTVGEDTEAAPQLPPPYVPDEEQYYNTRSGAGPPNQEGMYTYAVVDRRLK